jgi:hypothetical protein
MRLLLVVLFIQPLAISAATNTDLSQMNQAERTAYDKLMAGVRARGRKETQSGKIRTDKGNLMLIVDNGQHVGYEIGNETVMIDQLPEDLRDYTDDATKRAMEVLALGYTLGNTQKKSAEKEADLLQYVKETVDDKLGKAKEYADANTKSISSNSEAIKQVQTDVDEEVASKLQKSKEANAAAMKVLSESVDQAIAESKEATGDVSKSLETVKTQVDCLNKGDIIKDGKCEKAPAADPPQTCREVLDRNPKAASGLYDIEVQLEQTKRGMLKVYCDMVTDGGGWTMVGWWRNQGGYSMKSFWKAGKRVSDVNKWNEAKSASRSGGPAHYNAAIFNSIFFNNRKSTRDTGEMLAQVGTCPGVILAKGVVMRNSRQSFDAYRGVYDNEYYWHGGDGSPTDGGNYQPSTWIDVYPDTSYRNNLRSNLLPKSGPLKWTSRYSKGTRGCSGRSRWYGQSRGNCFHYFPDDINGGCHWLFRENADNTPGGSGGSYTGGIPSILMLR